MWVGELCVAAGEDEWRVCELVKVGTGERLSPWRLAVDCSAWPGCVKVGKDLERSDGGSIGLRLRFNRLRKNYAFRAFWSK